MREFEDLSEVEKAFRTLIYAAKTRRIDPPGQPTGVGEVFLDHILKQSIEIANSLEIPLSK